MMQYTVKEGELKIIEHNCDCMWTTMERSRNPPKKPADRKLCWHLNTIKINLERKFKNDKSV